MATDAVPPNEASSTNALQMAAAPRVAIAPLSQALGRTCPTSEHASTTSASKARG